MKTIIAIIALAAIVIAALFKDIDGALIASVSALIAGLGGYAIGRKKKP